MGLRDGYSSQSMALFTSCIKLFFLFHFTSASMSLTLRWRPLPLLSTYRPLVFENRKAVRVLLQVEQNSGSLTDYGNKNYSARVRLPLFFIWLFPIGMSTSWSCIQLWWGRWLDACRKKYSFGVWVLVLVMVMVMVGIVRISRVWWGGMIRSRR